MVLPSRYHVEIKGLRFFAATSGSLFPQPHGYPMKFLPLMIYFPNFPQLLFHERRCCGCILAMRLVHGPGLQLIFAGENPHTFCPRGWIDLIARVQSQHLSPSLPSILWAPSQAQGWHHLQKVWWSLPWGPESVNSRVNSVSPPAPIKYTRVSVHGSNWPEVTLPAARYIWTQMRKTNYN